MPIQWSGRITSQQQLAGVIQGEAGSDPAAQFAVASTMYNRMSMPGPYVGGGSGDVASVVLPSQFNGYNPNPNSNAMALAGSLMNGQPPPGGSTGNATFFAAPVQGNASWAAPGGPLFQSGTNIGGNYFSDQQGAPSANFQPPSYTGAGTTIATGPADAGGGTTPGGGDYLTMNPSDPNYGDITNIPVAGVNAPAASTGSGGAAPVGNDQGTPNLGGGVSQSTEPPGSGAPIDVGLQSSTTTDVTNWIKNLESSFGSGLAATLKAAETGLGTYFGSVQNWFTRAFLIIVGLVILAVALVALMWDHGGKETAQQVVRVAAV
jgi:hypothetical protein